jgi:hypothetical protein
MLSWREFSESRPEMADFGLKRIQYRIMYIATIRHDGYPRIHPFTPFVGSGCLFAFMEPTSPKAKDLQRDGRYSIHSLVADFEGSNGEFQITGRAILLTDSQSRLDAINACPYEPKDRYILFEFKIERGFTNYLVDGILNVKHWKEGQK